MMISCKRAAELTCQSLDRPLSRWERFKLWFHLTMCKHCAAFRKQSMELDRLIAQRFHKQITDDEFKRAVKDVLSEESCERIKQRLREAMER
jgi:hypothetical protein